MTMKRKIILRLSFLIAFLTLLWSCRNEDFVQAEKNPQRNNRDFFKHSKKGGAFAKTTLDYVDILEAYNREKNFLSAMPDQEGMPIWDKMQVVDTDNATGLMIPLSHDNETMSSVLFATLDQENSVTGVIDYDNKLLEDIVYNENVDHELRERLFYTFMYIDNKTFGTEQFTGIPKDLFSGKKYDTNYGRIWLKDLAAGHQAQGSTSKMLFIESCGSYWSCKNHESWKNCDHCAACYSTSCNTIMIYIPDEGFPGTTGSPGGGGGGGGGGTPGPQPPKDPCSLNTVFYRLAPGCGGGNTDIPDLDDPCEKTKNLLNNPEVQTKLDSLKKKSLTKGEIGFKVKKDGTVTGIISGGKHEVDLGVKAGYQGGYHNHTPAGIPMHSPPDIDNNLLAFARAQPAGEHKNAYFGMIVKKTCSGCPSGFKTYHYIIRFDGTYDDALTSFSQLDLDNFNSDYQKLESAMTDIYGPYGSTYIDSTGKITNEGLEVLFFNTVKKMGLTNKIILQRIEDNGIVNNINLNPDGLHTTPIPCL